MAYIYKKMINGKPYYYLRISKRVKGRSITKDVAYLGNDVSRISSRLDKLPAEYRKEIRKGYRNIRKFIESNHYLEKVGKLKENKYLSKDILKETEAVRLHFNDRFLKLDSRTRDEVYKNFLIDFAFNTTSIEGNTITLKEADKLLKENLTPKERSPREIFDLQNTEKVFFYLLEERPRFDSSLMVKVHDDLMKNIDSREGFRTHDIKVFRSNFEASPAKYIKTDISLLFRWYHRFEKRLHPLVLASLFHHKFESIHPFSDGNGRTGRMILNYILILRGYPPLIVKKKNRADYLRRLSKADKADINSINPGLYSGLAEYMAEELINSYWNNFIV